MSANLPVPASAEPLYVKMAEFTAQIDAVRATVDKPVTSAEQEREATRALGLLASVKSAIEERRVELKAPHLDAGKAIDAAAKTLMQPVLDLDGRVRRHVMDWKVAEQKRIEAEQRAAREENERRIREQREAEERERARLAAELAGPAAAPEEAAVAQQLAAEAVPAAAPVLAPVPVAAPATTRTDMGSSGLRKRWVFEVEAPALVPREYLVVDESAIRRAIASGVREIPGVKIWEEGSLAVRGAR